MKKQIEQTIAVRVAKKSHQVPKDGIVRALQQSGPSSSARYAPIPANRRAGTISLAWNKLN